MTRIGRYELAGEVGRGASGIVYRATDPAIGRTVAVKTIRLDALAEASEQAQLRDRLFREARAAGALLHPHIVTIFDAGEEPAADGQHIAYIAMELVEGAPLNERWPDQAIPPDRFLAVLSQTADALDYAHSKGLVHRDVKPANILVDHAGAAKVLDFGIAKIASQQMTHSGTLMGTPSYMSPEQIAGGALDGRSDQFSLAVIAYEMLTGEKPFRGDTLPALLYQVTHQSPPAAHLLNASLPSGVSAVLQRALSKHAVGRFKTCTAFVEALSQSLAINPEWHALPQGSLENLPTIAAQRPTAAFSDTTLAKPTPAALPDLRPPLRLEERSSTGFHWIAIAGLLFLIITGVFVYWAAGGGPVRQDTDPFATDSADRPSPMPGEPPPADTTTDQADAAVEPAVEASAPQPANPVPQSDGALPDFTATEAVLIHIATRPVGARVSIDNNARTCTAPCSLLLDKGSHLASYTLAGHRTLTRRHDVTAEADWDVLLERATGTLMLRSTPGGASIAIDGEPVPNKTPAVLTLGAGSHRFRLTLEGRPPYEETVEIKDQVISTLNIDW
jgi:serine/threonine protein kinase